MCLSKRFYYFILPTIFIANVGFLFYYAHLMPLHVDEAGFWFNWTNKSFLNRLFNENVSRSIYPPFHGLTIYLGKISLPIFGNNGIGLRFPVIFFGVSSSVLLYAFTKSSLFVKVKKTGKPKIDSFNGRGSLDSWLKVIVYREVIIHQKKTYQSLSTM